MGTRNHNESSFRGHENSATETETEENVNGDGVNALAFSRDDDYLEIITRLLHVCAALCVLIT